MLTLLHSLLPSPRIKSRNQKGNKFFSKVESKRAFISFSATEQSYKEQLDKKVVAEGSVAPFISVIGDMYKPEAFFCDFDNIKYKFFSITKAIDICFKAYHVFSIEYASAASIIWIFLDHQFYNVGKGHINPAVQMLCKTIQGQISYFYLQYIFKPFCYFQKTKIIHIYIKPDAL